MFHLGPVVHGLLAHAVLTAHRGRHVVRGYHVLHDAVALLVGVAVHVLGVGRFRRPLQLVQIEGVLAAAGLGLGGIEEMIFG